jgi:hypothetical protein
MKVAYLEIQLSPIGSLKEDSSGVLAALHEFLKKVHVYEDKREELSYWQLIFLQSKVNGCSYGTEDLPQRNWDWPKSTWFQERLSHQRRQETACDERDPRCQS